MRGTADHHVATARPLAANGRSSLARRARIDPKKSFAPLAANRPPEHKAPLQASMSGWLGLSVPTTIGQEALRPCLDPSRELIGETVSQRRTEQFKSLVNPRWLLG
jgi:hypothetical protein